MTRRIWIGLAAAVLAVLVGWYAASPFLVMGELRKAAQTGDRDRLEQLVDFPRVREGLKADFSAGLMKKAENDKELRDNPFAGLAAMFVPALVDRIVDVAVSPEGIARMQEGKGVATPPGAKPMGETPAAQRATGPKGEADSKRADKPKLTYHYSSLNRFRVVQPTDAGPMNWVFARQGLFGWRLIRIELPPKTFDQG